MDRLFAFEVDIDCLPMYVKRKLDRVAIKISRDQWLELNPEEQNAIAQLPAESANDCVALKNLICDVLARRGAAPVWLPEAISRLAEPSTVLPAAVSESARNVGFLLDQAKWSALTLDQRYALTKLVDSSKRAKRAKALREFLGGGL